MSAIGLYAYFMCGWSVWFHLSAREKNVSDLSKVRSLEVSSGLSNLTAKLNKSTGC